MTILVDKKYEEADRRLAAAAEKLVRARFEAVYGKVEGNNLVTAMRERMDHNVQTDGRTEGRPGDGRAVRGR